MRGFEIVGFVAYLLPMSLAIFLSHAWRDKRTAAFKQIERALREDGCSLWVDKREMDLGDDLEAAIFRAIEATDLVLALWSANYVASAVCRSEVDHALACGKPVVPIRLDAEDPTRDRRFRSRKYLDFQADPDFALLQLQQFLLRTRRRHSEALQADGNIGQRMQVLDDALAEIEDARYRRNIGASGNEASPSYVTAMLEAGRRMLGTSTELPAAERTRLAMFMDQAQAIIETHRAPAEDAHRKTLLRRAIDAIDPAAESATLQAMARALDTTGAAGDATAPHEPAAGRATPAGRNPMIDPLSNHIATVRSRAGADDALRQLLDQALGMPGHPQRAQCERALNSAIDAVPAILVQLSAAAQQGGVAHLVGPLIQQVAQYFLSEQDLIPDRSGTLGLLDDAYLAHAFLHQVNVAYAAGTGHPLLPFDAAPAIQVLRAVLGPQVSLQLDQWVTQGVGQAVAQSRFQQLQQWNGQFQGGGSRTGGPGSWGGSWEDEMARMGAEIGISFD
jgi:uncharacterized membrane protein YkvA (DUF1232 family)